MIFVLPAAVTASISSPAWHFVPGGVDADMQSLVSIYQPPFHGNRPRDFWRRNESSKRLRKWQKV